MTDRERDLRRANAFLTIKDSSGWLVVLEIIEEMRQEIYLKWRKMSANDLTTRKGFNIRAQANAFNELLERLSDLEAVLKTESKRR